MNTEPLEIPVAASAPYPPVEVSGPNLCYARKISQALGCAKSELSAITAYQYQAWVLDADCPELARIIVRIARVEMHHLDILGRLVTALGGDPRYACEQHGRRVCWNSGMLSYSRDLRILLADNIADERKAAAFYEECAGEITDPLVSVQLSRLAQDELLHAEIFAGALQKLDGGKPQC